MKTRIYLTGKLAVEAGGAVVFDESDFRGQQTRPTFAYAILERARPIRRDELAELIWPGELPGAWESGLSALVSRLRGLLTRSPLDSLGAGISVSGGDYLISLPADSWVDAEAAASAVDEAEGTLRAQRTADAWSNANVAAAIARRGFLEGDEGEWVARQRDRLQRQHLRALDCLAGVWIDTGEPNLAAEAVLEAIAIDPFREQSYRLLMQSHVKSGNRAEAAVAYRSLQDLLQSELDAAPSPETERIYRSLAE
jgi:DNA-binding SARP family transcriptional activator